MVEHTVNYSVYRTGFSCTRVRLWSGSTVCAVYITEAWVLNFIAPTPLVLYATIWQMPLATQQIVFLNPN